MHLKPAGIYIGTKRHPGENTRRTRPQPHRQSSQEPPAPGAFPEMAGSRHISLQGSPDSGTCSRPSAATLSRLAAAREHASGFNPPQTTHGRHWFCGTPRDHLHQHTHLQTPHSSAGSAFTIKIHLQKPGLKLRWHKLSSDLGLWVRDSDIAEELLAQPRSF